MHFFPDNVSIVLAACSHGQLIGMLNCIFHYSSTSSFFCYIKLHNLAFCFHFHLLMCILCRICAYLALTNQQLIAVL